MLDRDRLLAHMERLRALCRERGQGEIEDAILEVMDYVHGWCSPHMCLEAKSPALVARVTGFVIGGRADCVHEWQPVELHHDTTGYVDRDWSLCIHCGGVAKVGGRDDS